MQFVQVILIHSGKCLLHTPKEDERGVDGHGGGGGGGGGKKVKKMKKDRSFSGASTGGSQQVRCLQALDPIYPICFNDVGGARGGDGGEGD